MNKDRTLVDILPHSIKQAPTVEGTAKAIHDEYKMLWDEVCTVLHYPRLNELPHAVLDLLAWQFHVDFYDQLLSISQKRNLVLQSIAWHRMKGTPLAVERMVEAVYASGKVLEWYEYGGEPYHFKVVVQSEPIQDAAVLDLLTAAINEVKNVRSWLDPIEFTAGLKREIYVGAAVGTYKELMINVTVE